MHQSTFTITFTIYAKTGSSECSWYIIVLTNLYCSVIIFYLFIIASWLYTHNYDGCVFSNFYRVEVNRYLLSKTKSRVKIESEDGITLMILYPVKYFKRS